MLPDTANDIVCRLGNAVFRERTHGLIHRSDFDGTYNMQYCDGGCCIRRLAGNRVVVMINVPFIVGVRYERRFRYFEKKHGESCTHFKRMIIYADEEDALTAQTLVLMGLLRVKDSEE